MKIRPILLQPQSQELLARLEVRNIMSRNFNSRILTDITSSLLGAVFQRPGTPTTNENVLFLN